MPIDFRKPQYFKEFRFGSTLVWSVIKEIVTPIVVSGVSPLTLANAAAKEIRSLIQYGKCATVNDEIYCNNGKLMAMHQSGLPSGYKLLEYVGGSGSQYIITDVYLASTDVVECEFRNSTTTGYGAVYGVFKLGESSALYGNQTYYGYNASNDKVNTRMEVDTEWHSSRHDFANGMLTVDDTTVTFTPFEFVNSTQNAVLSRYYNNSYGYNWKGYIRKFKVTRNGEAVCDLLPAKDSNNIAGLYDLISGNFYTATGGDLLEGNEVDDYELRVVGTPEVLSVGAQTATVANLFAVGDVKDEQDIISGIITHRTKTNITNGIITIQVLTEPITEQVQKQPLSTIEGTNTVLVEAEVNDIPLKIEYYTVG